jgi:hypothetical protein
MKTLLKISFVIIMTFFCNQSFAKVKPVIIRNSLILTSLTSKPVKLNPIPQEWCLRCNVNVWTGGVSCTPIPCPIK